MWLSRFKGAKYVEAHLPGEKDILWYVRVLHFTQINDYFGNILGLKHYPCSELSTFCLAALACAGMTIEAFWSIYSLAIFNTV